MKWLKQKLLTYLTRNLLCAVDETMVITQVNTSNNQAYYLLGKEKMTPNQVAKLHSDARIIQDTDLWNILENTLRSQSYKMMFTKSQTFDDVLSGKLMLYNLDVMKKILDTLSGINLQDK
tara:strand:- start:4161 stop:4520 length:360 start_codon:yes stop_codon:yes gene_type:complete